MEDSAASLFQKRRKLFIRISVQMGLFLLCCFVAMAASIQMKLGDGIALLAFIPFFLTIIAWVIVVFNLYRCPSCNKVPMTTLGRSYGVDFNPSHCPKCGTEFYADKV